MKNNPFSKIPNNFSFSPLRLFVIVNFIAVLGLIFLSRVLSPAFTKEIQINKGTYEANWKFLMEHLFDERSTNAARFEQDIKIELSGDTIPGDFKIVSKMVDELKPLIKSVNIEVVKTGGNFSIMFHKKNDTWRRGRSVRASRYRNEIVFFDYTFFENNFSAGTDSTRRNKEIYKLIVTNLYVNVKTLTTNPLGLYSGTYENLDTTKFKSETIPFPYDENFIISKLYAKDFYQQLKNHMTQKYGWLSYYKFRFKIEIQILSCSLALVFLLIYFGLLRYFKILENLKKWKRGGWFLNAFVFAQGFILASIILLIDALPYDYQIIKILKPIIRIGYPALIILTLIARLYIIVSLILIVVNLLQNFFIREDQSSYKNMIRSFLITFLSCYIIYLALFLNQVYPTVFFIGSYWRTVNILPSIFENNYGIFSWYIFLCFALAPFVRLFIDYTSYLNEQRILAKDLELSHLREANTKAELLALHARINPHFLYNALNSIAGLVRTDPDRTEKVALSLSELFRHTLGRQSSQFIPLQEEVNMVAHYLEIEKIRFGNRMNYEIRLPDSLKDLIVPRFMVLPLVENAVKHGVSQIPGEAFVKVEIAKENGEMLITVYDNGPDFPELLVGGSGLQNLQDMLHLLYGDDYEMHWKNKPDKYIRLVLRKEIQEKPGKRI